MIFKLFIIYYILLPTYSYLQNTIHFGRFNSVNIFKPSFTSKSNTSAIIFFRGGSSIMPPDIYTKFIDSLVDQNIAVYCPFFRFNKNKELISDLSQEYKSISVLGHSSGCSTAINFCQNENKIKKIILLDPVDTFYFTNITINLPYIRKILYLIASKTYSFTFDPSGIPFIPFLGYKSIKKKIQTSPSTIVKCAKENDFGHSDILDIPYSNFMHYTRISVGNKIRTKKVLHHYIKQLSVNISKFI